jgi:outer membrane protein assembly factor BamB
MNGPRHIRLIVALAVVSASLNLARSDNWPAWRGPKGSGVSHEKQLPLHWSTNENVRWCVPLPDRGNSTPVIWDDRVFVTQAIRSEQRRLLLCFDRRDGALLWRRGPIWTSEEPTSDENPPCTPSPVTDGHRVIVWFGSAGVYCFDFEGRELWRRDLGRQSHPWGYASSPVLRRHLCFISFGPGERSFLAALDKKTGRTVWRYEPPALTTFPAWEANNTLLPPSATPARLVDVAGSWGTPVLIRVAGHRELVAGAPLELMGLAPKTGQKLWTCRGPSIGLYSSPFQGSDTIVLNASGLTNIVMAVRPGGRGDVTATHRLWIQYPGQSKTCLGAGVILKDHLYQVNSMGIAECRDLKTGELVWEERLAGSGPQGASWSCPVLAGDRIYAANRSAEVFVLQAAPRFECLATNSIGYEPMNASLAMADDQILLRTDKHLWCIGQPVHRKTAAARLTVPAER